MNLVLLALALLLAGGVLAWRWPRAGVLGAVAAGVVGVIPAARSLLGGGVEQLALPWRVPYGSLALELDPLSAFFLLVVFALSAVAAVYGDAYLAAWRGRRRLGGSWFFYNVLVASMVVVLLARNGVLFLVAWETMALASFFLVTFEDEQPAVREAGWTYLVASHLGTAFLLALFVLLGRGGSLDFDQFDPRPAGAGALFLLAVVGFGTKAGFMPLHVWLPEAHPAAPSHVSALMSGVMIKLGIYGLLRVLTLLGPPPAWWGWVLVGVGLSSGVLGVLFALAQHDLKRLLAYHSVENIGIIALGMGVGLLGLSSAAPALAALGFAGALLHVANHALFKGLLFLGAGSVVHATGTRDMEHLGGLLKRMPWTGATFLVGAVAICGLPPLNGFVSEFLIYLGSLRGAATLAPAVAVPLLATVGALALIGGLAAACFAKAFGVVFLGEPRSDHGAHAHEAALPMRVAMVLLAAGCAAIGLLAPAAVRALAPVVGTVTGLEAGLLADSLGSATGPLTLIVGVSLALVVVVSALACLRWWLLAGRDVRAGVTWDCGYARPTARMQYTASSFAQPLTGLFAPLLRTRVRSVPPAGLFPRAASLATETPDPAREEVYGPVFRGVAGVAARLRWLQHGNLHLYVLYIALTLVVLLVWKLG